MEKIFQVNEFQVLVNKTKRGYAVVLHNDPAAYPDSRFCGYPSAEMFCTKTSEQHLDATVELFIETANTMANILR